MSSDGSAPSWQFSPGSKKKLEVTLPGVLCFWEEVIVYFGDKLEIQLFLLVFVTISRNLRASCKERSHPRTSYGRIYEAIQKALRCNYREASAQSGVPWFPNPVSWAGPEGLGFYAVV